MLACQYFYYNVIWHRYFIVHHLDQCCSNLRLWYHKSIHAFMYYSFFTRFCCYLRALQCTHCSIGSFFILIIFFFYTHYKEEKVFCIVYLIFLCIIYCICVLHFFQSLWLVSMSLNADLSYFLSCQSHFTHFYICPTYDNWCMFNFMQFHKFLCCIFFQKPSSSSVLCSKFSQGLLYLSTQKSPFWNNFFKCLHLLYCYHNLPWAITNYL